MKKLMLLLVFLGGTAYGQVSPILSVERDPALADLVGRAVAHFHPEMLGVDNPHHLNRATCGTMTLLGLRSKWSELSPATKTTFASLLQRTRPSRTETQTSPSGHFQIHYNTTGIHAVSLVDSDSNGIPDYVDATINAFDKTWAKQIDELGYMSPPSDGDNVYDIYITSLGSQSVYGLTWPSGSDLTTSSYIEIDNDFTDAVYYTSGIEGLEATAAHEFFHAIQFAYYADFGASWWQEMSATWMEDVVYPDINDYYAYVPSRMNDPESSIDYAPGGTAHPFGGAIFAHHLEQVYGIDAIRNVWVTLGNRAPSSYKLSEIDAGMPAGGLSQLFPRYAVWNYLTNTRARPNYYTEASDLQSVKMRDLGVSGSGTGSETVDHLAATYVRVETQGLSGGLRGVFTLANATNWTLVVVLVQPNRIELMYPQSSTVVIPNVNRYSEVAFIPVVTSMTSNNLRVDYTISSGVGNSVASDLVADFDADGSVNFNDFVAFSQGFGVSPNNSDHNPFLDLNGDGPVDFQDFLIFVSHFGNTR